MTVLRYFVCALVGYLCGGINPSYLLGKLRGFDIRRRGSGNAGASNAVILLGKRAGVFIALFDIFKAFLAIKLMAWIFPEVYLVKEVTGLSVVLGHIFPLFMHFRGGKGLACLGGVVLEYSVLVFVCMICCAIPILLATQYICSVPIGAAVAFPIIYAVRGGGFLGTLLMLLIGIAIFYKHLGNLARIAKGTEARISFLWNKDAELERLRANGVTDSVVETITMADAETQQKTE